ncbi:response regulator [bacterium]|nr:response regulator [bacterium]
MVETIRKYRILVVDDNLKNIQLLRAILEAEGYDISIAQDGVQTLEIVRIMPPDLVLLDIMMPEMDGYETCKRLKSNATTARIPVIFVSALAEMKNEQYGFEIGCVDYITKPISAPIVRARVKTHLFLYDQQLATEKIVIERTLALEKSQNAAIYMLGDAGHYNDTNTGVHIWRMAAYSAAIAKASGWNVDQAAMLELAAPMHDTGKIGIPDHILKKPEKLDPEEWEIMKTHSRIGFNILSRSDTPLFQMAAEIALSHHEKWDGSGYPQGMKGEKIAECARIVAVADVYDALTTKRPYKEVWPVPTALEEMRNKSGHHLDPHFVDCLLNVQDEIRQIKERLDQTESQHPTS